MRLPVFLYIGMARAGSAWLFEVLRAHDSAGTYNNEHGAAACETEYHRAAGGER